jgi:hypothetical protein
LDNFGSKGGITPASVALIQHTILAEIALMKNLDMIPKKRKVVGNYRGYQVFKNCDSFDVEVMWKTSLVCKSLAVDQGSLQALWCEDCVALTMLSTIDVPASSQGS